MTILELIGRFNSYRKHTNTIYDCAFNDGLDACTKELQAYIRKNIEYVSLEEKEHESRKVEQSEKVNHPTHYNRDGAMECIDEMIVAFGKEATINFCLCNAWKYRYRAGMKGNAEEDLKKSDWYIQEAKKLQFVSDDA